MSHYPGHAAMIVPAADEEAGVLLDEWDTYITAYEQAMCDAADARRELAQLREPMAIIEAETLLQVGGWAEAERWARALLALGTHDGWRGYQQALQAAHERIHEAERRAAVARMRADLVRAALAATLRREHVEP